MKKFIAIGFFILTFHLSLLSQNNLIHYSGGIVNQVFLSAQTGEEITEIPTGKDCMVAYDTFFKQYTLIWKNSTGGSNMVTYKYIQDLEDGWLKVEDTESGTVCKMKDLLSDSGALVFQVYEDDEKVGLFIVEDLKRN